MKSFLIRGATLTILIVALSIILPNYVQAATIRVEAFIDGRSQLIIRGNTVQWYHLDADAPGQWNNNYPTVINDIDWFPLWSGNTNNCHGCYSDVFFRLCPGMSAVEQTVTLTTIQQRDGDPTIIQQPLASNNYTLIVEFNDNPSGGAYWYIIELNFPYETACPIPTMTEWGMIIFMALAGLGSVYYLRRQKRVNS
jgi:hypothetical protein